MNRSRSWIYSWDESWVDWLSFNFIIILESSCRLWTYAWPAPKTHHSHCPALGALLMHSTGKHAQTNENNHIALISSGKCVWAYLMMNTSQPEIYENEDLKNWQLMAWKGWCSPSNHLYRGKSTNTVHGLFLYSPYKLIMVFTFATHCRKKNKNNKTKNIWQKIYVLPSIKIFPIWSLKENFPNS